MLEDSGLPHEFWGHAIDYAAYTRNLLPASNNRSMTRYQAFHGCSKPDVSRLRVFGSLAYVHVPKPRQTSKLNPRGTRAVFLGLAHESKGAYFLTSSNNKRNIVLSRDYKVFEAPLPATSAYKVITETLSGGDDAEPGEACMVCASTSSTVPSSMLLCDSCNAGYHYACLGLSGEPEGAWWCPVCAPEPDASDLIFNLPPSTTAAATPPSSGETDAPDPEPSSPVSSSISSVSAPDTDAPAMHNNDLFSSSSSSDGRSPPPPRYPPRNRAPPVRFNPSAMAAAAAAAAKRIAPAFLSKPAPALLPAEPANYLDALSRPDASRWVQAMNDELASLHSHATWEVTKLPPGVKPIPTKWVYAVKRAPDGSVARYKARLVAAGYRQRPGLDYTELYSPVAKSATMRVAFAFIAKHDYHMSTCDVKTAYLNAPLEETIFVTHAPGYNNFPPGTACKLNRSLYGLRQSGRCWYMRLSAELKTLGFTPASSDAGLFIRRDHGKVTFILCYVDDLIIAAATQALVDSIIAGLKKSFDIHDMGATSFYLGIDIKRDRASRSITISQQRYIQDVLARFEMTDAKTSSLPIQPTTQLSKTTGVPLEADDRALYPEIVGSLLYLSEKTRPDLAHSVGTLSKFMSCPTTAHLAAARNVLRYVLATPTLGITYSFTDQPTDNIHGFCDASFAGDTDDRRSTTGYVFMFGGGAVSWSSRRQPTIAASTCESEYQSASAATREALWLRILFNELGQPLTGPLPIGCDNQAAISLIKNPLSAARAKHIDVLHHFTRERVVMGLVSFAYIPTDEMIADSLTKLLSLPKFEFCRNAMVTVTEYHLCGRDSDHFDSSMHLACCS